MAYKKVWEREEARRLRAAGHTIPDIAKQLNVSKGSVSYWVRGVELSQDGEEALKAQRVQSTHIGRIKGSQANRDKAIEKRKEAQLEGRIKAREGNLLHAMGCMLYWAEGAKSKNCLNFVNSDANMMSFYMKFLRSELHVQDEELVIHVSVQGASSVIIKLRAKAGRRVRVDVR